MSSGTDITTLLEGYRLCCVAEGKSPQTTRWYAAKLRVFGEYLESAGLPIDIAEIELQHIRGFLVYLSRPK